MVRIRRALLGVAMLTLLLMMAALMLVTRTIDALDKSDGFDVFRDSNGNE